MKFFFFCFCAARTAGPREQGARRLRLTRQRRWREAGARSSWGTSTPPLYCLLFCSFFPLPRHVQPPVLGARPPSLSTVSLFFFALFPLMRHVHPPVPGARHPPSLLPLKAHVLHISMSFNMRNIPLRVHSTFYTAALSFQL